MKKIIPNSCLYFMKPGAVCKTRVSAGFMKLHVRLFKKLNGQYGV